MVAELAAANGFKAAYAIRDGAEGPRGWMVFAILISFYYDFTLYSNLLLLRDHH